MSDGDPEINRGSSDPKTEQKTPPPSNSDSPPKDILSSRKHNMDYVDVMGVVLRTGYADKTHWYLLCIKELLDNAIDFLWKEYRGDKDTAVSVEITLTSDLLFHLKVRNTNNKNIRIKAFEDLTSTTLNYEMRYGSKQNQHIISRGMLGDAMKQILAWPYVLFHTKDDGSAFTDIQWDKPLIIRSNKTERHIFLHVDKANQIIEASPINQLSDELSHTDTEIETTWPIIDEVQNDLNIHKIEQFCRQYILFTTDISFSFRLIDNSMDRVDEGGNLITSNDDNNNDSNSSKKDFAELFMDTLASPARKATIKIDAPACHSINPNWKNISTIHSFTPEEFTAAITSVYDKQNTTVYDVLRTFVEGTQMKKTSDVEISIADFMQDPDRSKKIESLFNRLRRILDPPKELSLPYSHIKREERKKALVDRIVQLYPTKKNYLDADKATYKLVTREYDDESLRKIWTEDGTRYSYRKGKGLLHFPFVFEIVAIPLSWDVVNKALNHGEYIPSKFIGAVNYSLSPRGNIFEGDYDWRNKRGEPETATSAEDILRAYDFVFSPYASNDVKLPTIVVANLVSQRIDYHGHDKSRIDTAPFVKTIIEACSKIAPEIQSHKGAGFYFAKKRKFVESKKIPKKKFTTRDAMLELVAARKRALGLA